MYNVIIIGAGLIGKKRAESIRDLGRDKIVAFCDVDKARAEMLAKEFGGAVYTNYKKMLRNVKADVVIIATNHKLLPPMSLYALQQGMHVLAEKPLGRNAKEVKKVVELANKTRLIYKCGFNHRYHPALLKAREMVKNGDIGELMYVRARYGHGGRPGYDKEWRAVPDIAGGGELLDQGIHIIDLARWFMGDFAHAIGATQTAYWDMKPLEDNGFALLKTKDGKIAFLHASWTQWKNLFCFEIFGKNGFLVIDGLGKSYGQEKLIWGKRRPESGPPIIETFEYPDEDNSWKLEWEDLTKAIKGKTSPMGTGQDGLAALELIDSIYRSEKASQKRSK